MFKKNDFVPEGDMVPKHGMLVNLAHITNVRHHGQPVLAGKQADGDELAHAADTRTINLNNLNSICLEEILEANPVWNMFANCNLW